MPLTSKKMRKTSTMLNDDFKKSAILHISLLNKIKIEAKYMP